MSLASSTFEKPVAKWSCQKSTSFSCSGSFVLIMYFTHLLWRGSKILAARLERLRLEVEQAIGRGAARLAVVEDLLDVVSRRAEAGAAQQMPRLRLGQD